MHFSAAAVCLTWLHHRLLEFLLFHGTGCTSADYLEAKPTESIKGKPPEEKFTVQMGIPKIGPPLVLFTDFEQNQYCSNFNCANEYLMVFIWKSW